MSRPTGAVTQRSTPSCRWRSRPAPLVLVTATATDPAGNTFRVLAADRRPSVNPGSGLLDGSSFHPLRVQLPSRRERDGGWRSRPSSVVVTNFNQITATAPARPSGQPERHHRAQHGRDLGNAAQRLGRPFHRRCRRPPRSTPFVTRLITTGITVGVGSGLYGVDQPGSRGARRWPSSCSGPSWAPLPAAGRHGPPVRGRRVLLLAAWIEELFAQGVTAGCGGGNYCPGYRGDPPARWRSSSSGRGRAGYVPPACTAPTFRDVSSSTGSGRGSRRSRTGGITAGCGGGNYCPDRNVNTRGQIVRHSSRRPSSCP